MPGAAGLFDETGKLTNAETKQIIATVLNGFDTWIARFAP
jgi:hypothetical protein